MNYIQKPLIGVPSFVLLHRSVLCFDGNACEMTLDFFPRDTLNQTTLTRLLSLRPITAEVRIKFPRGGDFDTVVLATARRIQRDYATETHLVFNHGYHFAHYARRELQQAHTCLS